MRFLVPRWQLRLLQGKTLRLQYYMLAVLPSLCHMTGIDTVVAKTQCRKAGIHITEVSTIRRAIVERFHKEI